MARVAGHGYHTAMPRYDYNCAPCDLTFEVSRSFADSDLPVYCPMCEKAAVRGISVPLATFTRGAAAATPAAPPGAAAAASKWSHFGHSHGAGAGGHSHGRPSPPPAAPSSD
jgi:putative FmdB family regulatory protein